MSAKNKQSSDLQKNKKESEELLSYFDTEKLEEKLLGDIDTLENVGYILENIALSGDEKEKFDKNNLKDKAIAKNKKSPQAELKEDLEKVAWDLEPELEGELSLDVIDETNDLIIVAPVAGVVLNDIDINYSQGVLTIKGERKNERKIKTENYLTSECYWGKFSRSVFLPVEIDTKKIKAYLKNGVLTVVLPKLDLPANVDIEVKKI